MPCLASASTRKLLVGLLSLAHGPQLVVIGARHLSLASGFTERARYRKLARRLSTNTPGTVSKSQPLELLDKTVSFASRVLLLGDQRHDIEPTMSLNFWKDVLADASSAPGKLRVVVSGVDEWAGSEEVVSALLEGPFMSKHSLTEAIRSRWKDRRRDAPLIIEPSANSTAAENTTNTALVSSSLFQQIDIPFSLVETPPSYADALDASTLFKADVPVICVNPITTSVSTLLQHHALPLHNPNTIIVFNSTVTSPDLETHLISLVSKSSFRRAAPRLVFIDPARALAALDKLKSDSGSPVAVQTYQIDHAGSRVLTLRKTIEGILKRPTTSVRTNTVMGQIHAALDACHNALTRAHHEIDEVSDNVNQLARNVEEEKARIRREVLGARGPDSVVYSAVADAEKDMRFVMNDLTWWKAIWRVDDIGDIVRLALERVWFTSLEQDLILHTGRMSCVQQTLASSTFTLLSTIPTSSAFHSSLLHNSLNQYTTSPTYSLSPSTLTTPLYERKSQLAMYTTTRLHLAAHRTVMTVLGSSAVGAGVGCTGWVWTLGTGWDAGTALGLGALVGVLGLRWAISGWERAKRRWWEDWERVGEGLGRDIETVLEKTIQDQVIVVAEQATSAMRELADRRRVEIDLVREELQQLEDEHRRTASYVTPAAASADDHG